MKDYVKCNNCTSIRLVDCGEEICPNCGFKGALAWVNVDRQEVENDFTIPRNNDFTIPRNIENQGGDR